MKILILLVFGGSIVNEVLKLMKKIDNKFIHTSWKLGVLAWVILQIVSYWALVSYLAQLNR